MSTYELLTEAEIEARIQQQRTAAFTLRLSVGNGQPVPALSADLQLRRHEFKLGANAFRLGDINDPTLQEGYDTRFSALLNYATLPFYWGGYEPTPGQTNAARLHRMAEWCRKHGITCKGHPLTWHEVFPRWAEALPDADVLARQQARVKAIVSEFRGEIDIWDVVNEATVSQRFDNTIGRWIKAEGAAHVVAQALGWAHAANPHATLLYNDFNVSPEFEKLVGDVLAQQAPVNVIGIQSHMHQDVWPLDKAWTVCETYARFGLPLHFTELTVLSGHFKAANDNDWDRVHTDWDSTSEYEKIQLNYGQRLYSLLFSHPAVEAITWWDFSDNGSWQGAPSGLVRRDMTPKPLYDWLVDAFHHRWTTHAQITTDAQGRAQARGFFGDYTVRGTLPSGQVLTGEFTLPRHSPRELSVTLHE
jgi:GH35 family endo-1,4-beta-xylanase